MKRTVISTLGFVLSVAVVAQGAPAPLPAVAPNLQSELDQRVAAHPGTGIIMAIVDHGKTTVYKAGVSGTSRPLDEHTLFEIGSNTKTFTATMLTQLVKRGVVKLDDPVGKYLPAGTNVPSRNGKRITLLNLATQHSGLPALPTNINGGDGTDPYATFTPKDMYAFLNSYQLTRDPGAQWQYSNAGVGLLGLALSNATHQSYEAMLREQILRPLGMNETAITMTPQMRLRLSQPHDDEGDVVQDWTFTDAIAGAGAIRSSLGDMLKYLRCNMGQGPLAQDCLATQRPRDTMPGGRIGLIWWTSADGIINHGGDTAGNHAMVAISPDHQRGVVVLSNFTEVEDIGYHAIDAAHRMTVYEPVQPADPKIIAQYAGIYTVSEGGQTADVSMLSKSDKLYIQLPGQPATRIYPRKPGQFVAHAVDAEVDFQRDASGNVVAFVLYQDGNITQAIRKGVTEKVDPAPPKRFPAVVTLDAKTLQSYVGTYRYSPSLSYTVTLGNDGTLMVAQTGQGPAPMYPEAKDRFFAKIVDAQIEFARDTSGNVIGLVLHQLGMLRSAQKQ